MGGVDLVSHRPSIVGQAGQLLVSQISKSSSSDGHCHNLRQSDSRSRDCSTTNWLELGSEVANAIVITILSGLSSTIKSGKAKKNELRWMAKDG